MSSGRVRLATTGIQDSFLTGEPDVTYFIKKFTRYTKFALEVLNNSFFQRNIDFGSWVNVVIPKTGQLIRTIYVKLVLPPLSVGGYTNGIGNAIIEYADLVIGGQTIERITGEYMQIYDQIFISDSQQNALVYMVGTTPTGLGPATAFLSGAIIPAYGWYPRTFIVPLPFYFLKNEALAIPICSLTRQDVEVRIKFRPFEDVIDGGYRLLSNVTTTAIAWSTAAASPSNAVNVTWLQYSALFALIELPTLTYVTPVTSNIFYYNSSTLAFSNLTNITTSSVGSITCISQNNVGVILILTGYSSVAPYNKAVYSQFGPSGPFNVISSQLDVNSGFLYVDTNGTSFLAVNYNFQSNLYTLYNFTFINNSFTITNEIFTSIVIISLTWSPTLNAYIIGTLSGTMYTYILGAGLLNQIVGITGPYTAYSPVYGQIYNNSPVAASNTVISNVYASSFDGGINWVTNTPVGTSSISYAPDFDIFFTLQVIPIPYSNVASTSYSSATYWLYANPYVYSYYTYSIGTPNTTTTQEYPVALSAFQASLPVEYVFLSDDEIKYIQSAKVDYVITQLQLAQISLPAVTDILSAYRLYFINPVKELFFVIQDSAVLLTNDYFNYTNTTTDGEQLINLELQFNGEDIITRNVADALYLGKVQFLKNHTRVPDMPIYNYSFAVDPENYLPSGQVNMSRIMDQSISMSLTQSDFVRNIRVYAVSYNILRVQNGLAGVMFIDNNFI